MASGLVSDLRRLPAVRAWLESETVPEPRAVLCRDRGGSGCRSWPSCATSCSATPWCWCCDSIPPPCPTLDRRGACSCSGARSRAAGAVDRRRSTRPSGRAVSWTGSPTGLGPGRPITSASFPREAGGPPEWYVSYPDGTFAFSNSESHDPGRHRPQGPAGADVGGAASRASRSGRPAEVQGRATPATGTGAGPTLRRSASDRAADWSSVPGPSERLPMLRIIAMLERYLAAVEYAGAVLSLGCRYHRRPRGRDARSLPARPMAPPVGRRCTGGGPVVATHVPPTALALASAHVDAIALRDAIFRLDPRGRNNLGCTTSRSWRPDCSWDRISAHPDLARPGSRLDRLLRLAAGLRQAPRSRTVGRSSVALPRRRGHRLISRAPGDRYERPSDRSGESDGPKVTLAAALDNALRTLLADDRAGREARPGPIADHDPRRRGRDRDDAGYPHALRLCGGPRPRTTRPGHFGRGGRTLPGELVRSRGRPIDSASSRPLPSRTPRRSSASTSMP